MSLRSIETYNTDTCGSWGIGQETMSANNTFCQVLERAIELKAKIILQTSKTEGVWYIKGTNNNKTYFGALDVIEKILCSSKSFNISFKFYL